MFENILSAMKGPAYTPQNQGAMDQSWSDYNSGKITADEAGAQTNMIEKGSIMGMTPSTFASVMGKAGAAIAPEGSWQQGLGKAASSFGSAKLAQLAQAEKEKRMSEILKQVMGQAKSGDLSKVIDPNHPLGTPSSLLGSSLNIDSAFRKE